MEKRCTRRYSNRIKGITCYNLTDTIKHSYAIITSGYTASGMLRLLAHMTGAHELTLQVGSLEPKPKRDLLMTDFEVVEVVDFPRYYERNVS